jgi:hypothetical protein
VKAIAGAEFPFLARDLPTLNVILFGEHLALPQSDGFASAKVPTIVISPSKRRLRHRVGN